MTGAIGKIILVCLGSCIGGIARYLVENYLLLTGSNHIMFFLYALGSAVAGFAAIYLAYLLTRIP